ncbi:MAG: hypothetical protein ACOYM3_07280 [Terrimicrobiaceae bacterium]
MLKLQQDQVWKISEGYIRIVRLERLSVAYKAFQDITTRDGTHHEVSKKEFTRLIKSGTLLKADEVRGVKE